MSVPVSELQKVAPSSVIELFEIQTVAALHGLDYTYRFHAGTSALANGRIYWDGNAYDRMPIECDGFEYSGNGQLPRPKLRASNIMGTISMILLTVNDTTAGNDLVGAKVTRIRTMARYIDAANFPGGVNPYGTPDPTAEFPREVYYIDRKVAETRDVVEWELASVFDLIGVRAPKRQCISNICQWVYRSTECGYSGPPVVDANDQPLPGVQPSPLGVVYNNAEAAFNISAATLSTRTSELNTARNNLNAAQGDWYLAETRYTRLGSASHVRIISGQTTAVWSGSTVSLGETYRQGIYRERISSTYYYEIQRWTYDNTAVVNAQNAYNTALSNYNTALADYNTKLAAKNAAFTAWQTSPQFVGDINASGDECGKRLSSCRLRFGPASELPFGSFPGIGTYFT